jgi:hypothetical protein
VRPEAQLNRGVLADILIRHGKDDKLIVWKITEEDESLMSTALPVDDPATSRKQPWLLHLLRVNTLNFCSFASCKARLQLHDGSLEETTKVEDVEELLIAVPNTLSSEAVSFNPD